MRKQNSKLRKVFLIGNSGKVLECVKSSYKTRIRISSDTGIGQNVVNTLIRKLKEEQIIKERKRTDREAEFKLQPCFVKYLG